MLRVDIYILNIINVTIMCLNLTTQNVVIWPSARHHLNLRMVTDTCCVSTCGGFGRQYCRHFTSEYHHNYVIIMIIMIIMHMVASPWAWSVPWHHNYHHHGYQDDYVIITRFGGVLGCLIRIMTPKIDPKSWKSP